MATTKASFKLDAPPSDNTVRVRMVDTTTYMVLHSTSFIKPVVPGHETMNGSDVAFLIENERLGKKAMFDLGCRKDYWNLPPTIRKRFEKICTGLKVPSDVASILQERNIPLESIDDIIWSHSHWDHTGDPTLFPPTTNLVYGAEISTQKPYYPENPNSPLSAALFKDRKNIEISFEPNGLTVGGFPAHDFYDDGSFYLLSTPGHAKGHMCALARTTPDTFIFLGGDVCHFPGDLRPNPTYPMPDPIPSGVLDSRPDHHFSGGICPASFFLDEHPQFPDDTQHDTSPATTPYYKLSTAEGTVYETPSPEVARATVDNLIARFDSAESVLVAIAHDPALLDNLPTLNAQPEEDLNAWFENGWKDKCYWGWLNEVAWKGKSVRERIVEGWWRDGKMYESVKEMMDAGPIEDGSEEQAKLS